MTPAKAFIATVLIMPAFMATKGLAGGNETESGETGRAVYETHCLVCHQADGGGVPMMQPELWNSPRTNGPATDLIRFVLAGSAGLAPEDRAYTNEMPGFSQLNDQDLAAVLTYIRSNFENDAPKITPSDVAKGRKP